MEERLSTGDLKVGRLAARVPGRGRARAPRGQKGKMSLEKVRGRAMGQADLSDANLNKSSLSVITKSPSLARVKVRKSIPFGFQFAGCGETGDPCREIALLTFLAVVLTTP